MLFILFFISYLDFFVTNDFSYLQAFCYSIWNLMHAYQHEVAEVGLKETLFSLQTKLDKAQEFLRVPEPFHLLITMKG